MLSLSGSARAQQSPAIRYSASSGCPDEAQFLAVLASQLRGDSKGLAQPIGVELVQGDGEATGRVAFVGEDGQPSVRALHAPTCGEVAAAAALVVALAIDTQQAARSAAPVAEPPAAPEPEANPASIALVPSPVPGPPRDALRRKSPARSVFFEMGAGAVAEQDVAPEPLLGGTALFGVGDREAAWNLRARVAYGRSGVVASGEQQARFTLLAGGLDVCVWPIVSGQRWAVQPCAAGELGRVQSEGIDSARYAAVRHDTIWGAGGPLLRAQGAFDELRVELYGGPWFPFAGTRTFIFEGAAGQEVFYRGPAVGWLGGVNLVFRLD